MQEKKKYQIEKVAHGYISSIIHTCCLIDYSKKYDELIQLNYSSEENAFFEKEQDTVGMWRVKPTDK